MPRRTHDTPSPDVPPRAGRRAGRAWGVGEDPLAWSFPVPGLARRLRLHALVPVWIAAEMLAWLPRDAMGLIHAAALVGALLLLACLRELARSAWSRRFGCEPAPAIVWPLGGLSPTPPAPGGPPLLAECGGLLAGLVLLPFLGAGVLLAGAQWDALFPSLLAPRVTAASLRSNAQVVLWWAYYANLVILLANLLLPMSAFDAGRVLQSRVRRSRDDARGLVLRIGLFAALALFVIGASAGETRVMAMAALGALATFLDVRRLEFLGAHEPRPTLRAAPSPAYEPAPDDPPADAADPPDVRDRDDPPEPASLADLDAILAKISRTGLASLTPDEHRALARETERRRRR